MKRLAVIGATAFALVAIGGPAFADWNAIGGGSGYSRAGSLGTPGIPTAPTPTASSGVTLSWSAATLPGGALVKYVIERAPVAGATVGTFAAVSGGTCTSTNAAPMTPASAAAPSCTDPNTTAGTYKYRVTSAAGTDWRQQGGASADILVPTSTSATAVSPNVGGQGAVRFVTITGTNFGSGTTVAAGAGITVTSVGGTGATTRTATFTIAVGASAGPRDVTVTTSNGAATCSGCFTVNLAPTITGVTPNTGVVPRDGGTRDFTLTGSDFAADFTATTTNANYVVTSQTFVSSTQITVTVQNNLSNNGNTNGSIRITNGDGGVAISGVVLRNQV